MSAPDDLAIGFAEHATAWARSLGAPPEALAVLKAAAQRVSLATAAGSVCVPLAEIAQEFDGQTLAALRASLLASRMAGEPHAAAVLPLVIDASNRVYLRRYFDYERRLAQRLVARAIAPARPLDETSLKNRLDALFAANARRLGGRTDWQRAAVERAMRQRLAIVSGAPGTGKTTTVAALLACALEEDPGARIALAAPTGKAAARMLDALRAGTAPLPAAIRERLPSESHTLHRLLGVTPESGRFRHHADNPLPLDLLVVDEASMLDLALAARLADAVPSAARLVFLGDKDQLAAVEVGSVFSELSARDDSPLAASVVWLTESHRFPADSGIGRLAAHINAGEAAQALAWLRSGGDASIAWVDESGGGIGSATRRGALEGYAAYLDALRRHMDDKTAVFRAFERFRVLCAVRDTARGVNALNHLLAAHLREALAHPLDPGARSPWYPGRPVMVMKNDSVLRLFNGDIGICLPGDDGQLAVWFPDGPSGYRALAASRLPWHEDAFATTVHKAQGSQFDEVLLILPQHAGRTAVRELLYTAVTRPRARMTISSSADVFTAACARATERHTGLVERMREAARLAEAHDRAVHDRPNIAR